MKKEKATIEDFARMCNKNSPKCEECPLTLKNNGKGVFCIAFIRKFPNEANEIVSKWCEEHPVKTRQEKFLEMFPNAGIGNKALLVIKPCMLDVNVKCRGKDCPDCRQIYWSEEVEE